MYMLILLLSEVSLQTQMKETDYTLLFSDEAWFHLSGYINSQKNRYWSAEIAMLIHNVPFNYIMVAVQHAISATRITDLFVLHRINNIRIGSHSLILCKIHWYVTHSVTPIFVICPITRKFRRFFDKTMQTILGTAQSVFGDRITRRGLWPTCSPDVRLCHFCLWGMSKDQLYSNNPHRKDNLKEKHSGYSLQFHQ
jgi:hypothetical protein